MKTFNNLALAATTALASGGFSQPLSVRREEGLRFIVMVDEKPVAHFASVQVAFALLPTITLTHGAQTASIFDSELGTTCGKSFVDETGQVYSLPASAQYAVRKRDESSEVWQIVATGADQDEGVRWYEGIADRAEQPETVQLVDLTDLKVVSSTKTGEMGTSIAQPANRIPA